MLIYVYDESRKRTEQPSAGRLAGRMLAPKRDKERKELVLQ